MAISLYLVRTPEQLFNWGSMQGRFGELLAVRGPAVTAASLVDNADDGDADIVPLVAGERRALRLRSDDAEIAEIKRYTTIERMGGYVQLRPNCGSWRIMKTDGPYVVTVERGNSAVMHLYQGKDREGNWTGPVVHNGDCLRIEGAMTEKERAILIHEAPNVSWLTGCISPRDLNNVQTALVSRPMTNESYTAMMELFDFVGRERANFFVLDW